MSDAARFLVEQLLEEGHAYSTTQINLPSNMAAMIIQWGRLNILDDNLYYDEDGGLGREDQIHITVKYGLTDPAPSKTLMEILRKTKPFTVKITSVSLFEQEDYDVVKLDVESEGLEHLNAAITAQCPNEDKHPKYVPHCTVAYVKKGTASRILGQYPFENNEETNNGEFEVREVQFRGKADNGIKQMLPFNVYESEESPKEFAKRRKLHHNWQPPIPIGQMVRIKHSAPYFGGQSGKLIGVGKSTRLPIVKMNGLPVLFDWDEIEPVVAEASDPFIDLPFPVECSEVSKLKRRCQIKPVRAVL